MTDPEHPPVEQISDLLAGVLPAAEAMELNAHLASCEACRDERNALTELTDLLADEGATALEMPPDVAASIDAAISRATAERAAGVRRINSPPESPAEGMPRRQPWKWVGGAAAAVLVVAVGFAGLRALPTQSGSSDDAGSASSPTSAGDSLQFDAGGKESMATGGKPRASAIPPTLGGHPLPSVLSDSAVAAAGRELLRTPANSLSPVRAGCATPLTGSAATVVQFKGHPAVLTITRDTRLVTIFDCATATKTLFVTGY